MGVVPINLKFYLTIVIMTFVLAIVGCTKESTFEDLVKSNEVLVKGEHLEKKLTDADQISRLVNVIIKSKAIDPPERAIGIKPEVVKEVIMLHFPTEDFFYIGDGYLYHGNKGQYYSVSKDIENYTTE
ncbi:hypothetical protein [Cohnella lupini]|uniref:Uncharacterized protein n=1 Tax=Cohnella lupini TaxID=1294267 RepID=A0A3D9HNP7_9BACL|nr:hypothetical protein [Cohnella lupini]RED51124.1 hypothetical protein DFP95_1488 [Cohnella lupini]